MSWLGRLIGQAARQWAANPENREKAKRAFNEDVKPAAERAWRKAEPELRRAPEKLGRFVAHVKKQFDDGRSGR